MTHPKHAIPIDATIGLCLRHNRVVNPYPGPGVVCSSAPGPNYCGYKLLRLRVYLCSKGCGAYENLRDFYIGLPNKHTCGLNEE
jgi:hypothetical protein